MRIKTGDIVKLKHNLEVGEVYGGLLFTKGMACLEGKELTIAKVCTDNTVVIKETEYWLSLQMLEWVREPESK